MARKSLCGGAVALVLALGGTAQAADVPAASFAKRADRICSQTNAKALTLTKGAPRLDAGDAVPAAVVRRYGTFLALTETLLKDELRKMDAIGTPREPAAKKAWARWKVMWTTIGFPALDAAVSGSKSGKYVAMVGPLAKTEKYDAEGARLRKTLGFTVCSWTQ